jgi:hypothetical protein
MFPPFFLNELNRGQLRIIPYHSKGIKFPGNKLSENSTCPRFIIDFWGGIEENILFDREVLE